MKNKEVFLEPFTVVGISVRTTNQNHQPQGDGEETRDTKNAKITAYLSIK